jgi:cytochrome c oxidase subunit IV
MSEHEHAHDHVAHEADEVPGHGGIGKYIAVFVALCVLTGASFLTYAPFWREHVPTEASRFMMMAVSCTKAMLVVMFFMHLLWEANWKYVLTVPASFMSIFLMLMLVPDIGWRRDNGFAKYSHERLIYAAEPQADHDAKTSANGTPHEEEDHK